VQPNPTPVKPVITNTEPAALIVSSSPQTLKITGTGFQKDLTVTLTSPEGKTSTLAPTAVAFVTDKEAQISPIVSSIGAWKMSVLNPDKAASDDFLFQVIDPNSPSVKAYGMVFWVLTVALSVLALAILTGLIIAWKQGTWSLGTALSEESGVQPDVIRVPADVIMLGSTSRLIALVGLLGILGIVLGVGYSIIWNLFVSGKVPDLTSVRSFLFGAATLFAPYLANQVREAFDQSPVKTEPPPGSASLAINGVLPGSPRTNGALQPLTLTGSSFQPGLSATLINPQGTEQDVPPTQITVNPTQLTLEVTLAAPGTWKVRVAEPGGSLSATTEFAVYGPPTVAAVNPPAPTSANLQTLSFTGTGFLPGLTVTLTGPGGVVVKVPGSDLTTLDYTRIVLPARTFAVGPWRAEVTNPGGHTSAPFNFNVT